MEFYLAVFVSDLFAAPFQFPTGWNSTKSYLWRCDMTESFNSQRDGILHYIKFWKVNINSRFNSQRDGILQYLVQRHNLFGEFQFPTGWNSTGHLCLCGRYRRVSIPNGMEFYPKVWQRVDSDGNGFNSQRDGILHNRRKQWISS